jgi:mono/diheme cytochrome c family protein
MVKLVMALPMVMLGAVNLFNTRPAMKRAAAQAGDNSSLMAHFRRLVGVEVSLGLVVLLSVGVLTTLPPPQLTSTPPAVDFSTEVDDLRLALNITPGRVGLNTFTVSISSGGQPVEQAKEVALRFTPTTANVPPSGTQLIGQGNGQYAIKGSYLSLPDAWQVQAVVRREGKFDAFANFNIDISPTTTTSPYLWPQVNGALLLITAVAYAFTIGGLSRTRRQWLVWGIAPALALGWAGLTLFFRPPVSAEAGPVNPIPPNAASLSVGQTLYERDCLSCHGPTGLGDGPVGLTLNPRPADLTQHTIPGVHPDSQLYEWISEGFPGSVMPAFHDALTDAERWHLVNYIRTLAFATKE